MRHNELKNQILCILRDMPETRNSDITLMIEIWTQHNRDYIKKTADGTLGIWLKDLYNLPTQESIKRLRAMIQNDEGKYLPTSWAVAKQRKIKEIEWLEYVRLQTEYKRL